MSKVGADNKDIKFPAQHYVGFQSRPSQDNTPLGFMTPDGTDAAAKKRKESVDKWAQVYDHASRSYTSIPGVSYENKPMVGFKLSREVRRYASFGNGNVKWRIEDPRGFELEISSANFAQILMLCTMEKGEIQEQLIWGRLGSENILVPVESDAYKAAQANTERAAKKVSLKELNIGDHVVFQNGDEGRYLGVFYFIKASGSANNFQAKIGDKKRYVFAYPGSRNGYFAVATPKIAEITPTDTPGTQEASEQELNQFLNNGKSNGISENSNDYYVRTYAVTSNKPVEGDITIEKVEHTFDDLLANKPASIKAKSGFVRMSGKAVCFDIKDWYNARSAAPPANSWSSIRDDLWLYYYDVSKLDEKLFVPLQSTRYSYTSTDSVTAKAKIMDGLTFETYKVSAKTAYCGDVEMDMRRD
jgi:hypothetical protein